MERKIISAATLSELQAAGRDFGELRERGKLAQNELARIRLEYDARLDALEKNDPANPFRSSVASLGDSFNLEDIAHEATGSATEHVSHTAHVDPLEDLPFVRTHLEVVLPSVEVPNLQEGPPHIRDRSFVLTASKLIFTNTPRCAQVSGSLM